MYWTAHLTVPCPSPKNSNVKLLTFADVAYAGGSAIAIAAPVHSYR